MHEHVMSLTGEDIRVISTLYNDDINMSEEAISSEITMLCINTLNLEDMTPEAQSW